MASGIEVLLISGNDDGYVPTLGTRTWIGVLKKVVVVPVRSTPASADATVDQVPWVNNQTGQVGGYITKYRLASKRGGSFELAVVMNAGHQPPYFQPAGLRNLSPDGLIKSVFSKMSMSAFRALLSIPCHSRMMSET
jgi:hypothetical protein